ncbi:MAG TPA: penicillin-binding protein 1A [Acidiferrobacteraceae bacterium]|nr:penicillin-binding protein 1A [Acidiferrobacteraceae bacterium]
MKKLSISPINLLTGVLGLVVTGLLGLAVVALVVSPSLPAVETLRDIQLKVPLRVYTARGELMAEFGEERRVPVHTEEVPTLLIKAVLAAEDDSFYVHQGVDFLGIIRAAIANLRSGGHGQGASTITMQVARNYFLSPEKTYTRKIKEILLAFKIEQELEKNQILELYLNKIFLGHRSYGFAAAAHMYYGHPLTELTLPQMAMLAGLPKAPSRNNPLSNPENAKARRNYVLDRMYKLGFIDEKIHSQARLSALTATKHRAAIEVSAPYVAEMVRHYMVRKYGDMAYGGGYRVYTTIDATRQRAADVALRDGLMAYERRHGYRGPLRRVQIGEAADPILLDKVLAKVSRSAHLVPAIVMVTHAETLQAYIGQGQTISLEWEGLKWARPYISGNSKGPNPKRVTDILRVGDVIYAEKRADKAGQDEWWLAQVPGVSGAIVSIEPQDGRVVALSGGFDFFDSKFNRVIQARRQPGSNIKPFIYSAALEKGFTAASRVSGAPIVVPDVQLEGVWRPENYSGKFFGPTRLRRALTLSLNLVSVRLLRSLGPEFTVKYLQRFGFDEERLPKNLSLALGTASLTPMEVVSGFAVFANGGFLIEPYVIQRVENGAGDIVERANPTIVCATCVSEKAEEPKVTVRNESSDEQTELTELDTNAGDKRRGAKPEGKLVEPAQQKRPRYAKRAISAENAYIMTSMLQDVIKVGTGRRALVLKRKDLAGKTGTTNDFRDAWFSGFNRGLVTTVWVGFDQPRSLGRGEAGGRAALPIWIDYMRVALAGTLEEPRIPPRGITSAQINMDTGQPTTDDDPIGYREYFIVGIARAEDIESGDETTVAPPVVVAPDKAIPEGLF